MPAKHPGWDETKDKEGHNPIQELENLADAMVGELLNIPNTGGGNEDFNAGQKHYFPNLTKQALTAIPKDDLLMLGGRLSSVLDSIQTELKVASPASLLADKGMGDQWKLVRAYDSALRFDHSQVVAAISSRTRPPQMYRSL